MAGPSKKGGRDGKKRTRAGESDSSQETGLAVSLTTMLPASPALYGVVLERCFSSCHKSLMKPEKTPYLPTMSIWRSWLKRPDARQLIWKGNIL